MAERASIARMHELPGVPTRIADHLGELIVRGELAPGERIAEARITSSLGVSRGSVREALQLLARRHLVELIPRRGAFVTAMTEKDTRDLYELLIALYTTLAQLGAGAWRSPQDLAPLTGLLPEFQARAERADALAVIQISDRFTEAGCALVDNVFLTRALDDLRWVFNRSYYRALASDQFEFELIRDFIDTTVRGIEARDLAGIARAVRHYGEHQRDQVLNTF